MILKIQKLLNNKNIRVLLYIFSIALLLSVTSGFQMGLGGVLREKMTNYCPQGCKKPTQPYGNCKSVMRGGVEEYVCPWQCPDTFSPCEYDINCEGCRPWISFTKSGQYIGADGENNETTNIDSTTNIKSVKTKQNKLLQSENSSIEDSTKLLTEDKPSSSSSSSSSSNASNKKVDNNASASASASASAPKMNTVRKTTKTIAHDVHNNNAKPHVSSKSSSMIDSNSTVYDADSKDSNSTAKITYSLPQPYTEPILL